MGWNVVGQFSTGGGGTSTSGTPGLRGQDGATWLSGVPAPSLAIGKVGDYYFQIGTGSVWQKVAPIPLAPPRWTIIANITGPAGQPGLQGARGLQGIPGPAGALGLGFKFVKIVYFLTAGSGQVYIPTAGVNALLVQCIGGGAGGGGVATGVTNGAAAGGGGGGGFSQKLIQGAIASSYTLTVGAAGNGGTAGANNGQNGGQSFFGASLCLAKPGSGGSSDTVAAGPRFGGAGGLGADNSTGIGDIHWDGAWGGPGIVLSANQVMSGASGAGWSGGGGITRLGGNIGVNATTFPGSGGNGAAVINGGGNTAGGAAQAGAVIIWEFA